MYIGKCKYDVIVTIGRAFGSGARQIGKKIAEELEIPFYDKELLEAAAKESKLNIEKLAKYDEKRGSSFLYSMAFSPYSSNAMPLDMVVQEIQVHTINMIAQQGSCVIVGRRADKILRDKFDILSTFFSSSMENRVDRVSRRDKLSETESRDTILKMDKLRRAYYNAYGEGGWGEAANYNLCIDSGNLGIENSVDMILQYLKLKGKLL